MDNEFVFRELGCTCVENASMIGTISKHKCFDD